MANYPSILLQYEDTEGTGHSGVSIAWLLSNFGTGSVTLASSGGTGGSMKCKRRDILNVSIPETCKVISENGAELPLRFSSNLLYGVTVCYSKKTDFILSDVVQMKGQLQRKLFGLESALRQGRIPEGAKDTVSAQEFLADDPLFDVAQWGNVRLELDGPDGTRSLEIRQQDFLQELNNQDGSFVEAQAGRRGRLGSVDEELASIDMDLNFEIDDLVSEDGRRRDELASERSEDEARFELNFNDPFEESQNQLPDVIEGSLLQEDEDMAPDAKHPREEDQAADAEQSPEPETKKRKIAGGAVGLGRLVCDEKISLATETLRDNHNKYAENMEMGRKSGGVSVKGSAPGWHQLLAVQEQPVFLQKAFCDLLGSRNEDERMAHMERGRALARSSVPSSRSSSVMSTEQGRRMGPGFDTMRRGSSQSDTQSNLLPVFLEDDQMQHDTQLDADDEALRGTDFMNADLLPSSIGRTTSRYGTADSGEHMDILRNTMQIQARNIASKRTDTASSQQSNVKHSSIDSEMKVAHSAGLDDQTRKFYEYIKERADFVGKTTRSHEPYHKKLLFEDLIPSKVSQEDPENPHDYKAVSKRIAATAFLSLLNLASKELVRLETFDLEDKCEVMKGDDLIIYC
ncbi:AEL292Wp [Eremothecium gossypii ATCC 10895]|uniref:AEL292Wp n=1 Tax=Eremothecium gossypii (strain ATCC 10895 / CBS 109.51 / FGSC 9923 / NRRL Y-1056) TaxID=284811 RepID=Q758P5_EREGS|nr:AEL292Wp [Eremothecium gossypii ATCC 10895]AAS52392.2 AEL292Wp [Eremothecium gossypii ATCC 10895]AEY96689.1 FAEL292Wp [Eremothecium gossypii FDAG1]